MLLPWVVFFLRICLVGDRCPIFALVALWLIPVVPPGDLVRRIIDGFTPQTMGLGPESPVMVDRCSSPCRCSVDLFGGRPPAQDVRRTSRAAQPPGCCPVRPCVHGPPLRNSSRQLAGQVLVPPAPLAPGFDAQARLQPGHVRGGMQGRWESSSGDELPVFRLQNATQRPSRGPVLAGFLP